MNIRYIILLFLCVPLLGSSQIYQKKEGQTFMGGLLDTSYVKDHSTKLGLRLYGINKSMEYRIKDIKSGNFISFSPNRNWGLGVGFSYRWMALDLGISLPVSEEDQRTFGSTKGFDFQSIMSGVYNMIDVHLAIYDGHHIRNPQDYLDGFSSGDEFPKRSDIRTLTLGIRLTHLFNGNKFSMRSAILGDFEQIKSAGSPILTAHAHLFDAIADSSMIPFAYRSGFAPAAAISDANVLIIGVGGGYAYTFVPVKHFFLTLYATPSIGLTTGYTRYNFLRQALPHEWNIYYNMVGRASAGYSGDRFTISGLMSFERSWIKFQNNTQLIFSPFKVKLQMAYRIKVKKDLPFIHER